jgi:hypothetical protein
MGLGCRLQQGHDKEVVCISSKPPVARGVTT